jgi:hypothetical protein
MARDGQPLALPLHARWSKNLFVILLLLKLFVPLLIIINRTDFSRKVYLTSPLENQKIDMK